MKETFYQGNPLFGYERDRLIETLEKKLGAELAYRGATKVSRSVALNHYAEHVHVYHVFDTTVLCKWLEETPIAQTGSGRIVRGDPKDIRVEVQVTARKARRIRKLEMMLQNEGIHSHRCEQEG